MKFPRFGSRSTRARKATGQDRLSRRRQLLPEALEPRLMMAVLNGTTETIPILSLSGPTSAVISAQDSTAPQQTVTVSGAALDALQGAPTQGAPTQGAPTQGAPTQGAPTQGAPTSGAPTPGAGTPVVQNVTQKTVTITSSKRVCGYVQPKWFDDTLPAESSAIFLALDKSSGIDGIVDNFPSLYLSKGTDGKVLNDGPFELFQDLLKLNKADAYTLLKKTLPVIAGVSIRRVLIAFEVHEFWMTTVEIKTTSPTNQVSVAEKVLFTGVNYNVDVTSGDNTTSTGLIIDPNVVDVQEALDQANEAFKKRSNEVARNFDVNPKNNIGGTKVSDIQTIVAKEYGASQ